MPNIHRQMQAGFLVMPAGLAAQLLGTFLIARYLGPDRLGVFALIFAIMSVATFVTEMGMGTIITKLVAEGQKEPGRYIALALPAVIAACLVAATALVVVVCLRYDEPASRWAGVIAAANILVFGVSMVWSCTIRGLGQMGWWMAGFLGQKLLFLVFAGVGLIWLRGGLVAALGAWTLASAVVAGYYLVILWSGRVWRGRLAWSPGELGDLIRQSISVGLISAANQFGMQLDMFVLALLLTDRDVGIYALGQRLINPARNIMHGAVSTPSFPGLCRTAGTDREEFARRANRLCTIQWISGLPLVVMAWVAAPWIVPRFLPKFAESVPVIWITVWALVPACLSLQMRYVYTAMSRQSSFLGFNAIHLAIKCVLLLVLTWQFGLIGACYGTVGAELIFALLARWGLGALGVRVRLLRGIAGATAVTGAILVGMWVVGLDSWVAVAVGVGYLGVMAVYVNRQLRGVRERRRCEGGDGSVCDNMSESVGQGR